MKVRVGLTAKVDCAERICSSDCGVESCFGHLDAVVQLPSKCARPGIVGKCARCDDSVEDLKYFRQYIRNLLSQIDVGITHRPSCDQTCHVYEWLKRPRNLYDGGYQRPK